ncbi:MAG: hypothetical protein ACI90V_003681 [Bacillariaceae sp.]|jgi:hypothetical protein
MPIGGTAGMATAASAYEVQTVAALINFFHMSLGSPSIPEWINSINKNWLFLEQRFYELGSCRQTEPLQVGRF